MYNFDSVKEIINNLPPVGSYTRPDSQIVPAIWYGAEPPTEYTVKGIEILVTESDFTYSIPVGSPQSRLQTSTMQVSLVQHEKGAAANSTFRNLQKLLVEEMRKKYSQIEIDSRPGTNSVLEEFIVRGLVIEQLLLSRQ